MEPKFGKAPTLICSLPIYTHMQSPPLRPIQEMWPCVFLVPFPAQGHVTPMLRLGRALHGRGFRPVLALPDFIHDRIAGGADHGDGRVGFVSIPSGLGVEGDGAREFSAIDRAMEEHMPGHFERLLRGSEGVACVVVDLLASWAIGVAVRCGVPVAGFWPAMMATYRLISAIPELIRGGFISDCGTPVHHCPCCPHNQKDKVEDGELIPGHAKLSAKDLPWLVGNSDTQKSRFTFWLRTLNRASTLRWLLINSFPGEGGEMDEHEHPHHVSNSGRQIILQIGPLILNREANHQQNPCMWEEDKSCIEWLQTQRPLSVVYVSFGSWVAPFGPDKVAELALGLEATQRPFIWVLRDDDAWRAGLPQGFLSRVAGRGKVVAWAPQEEVLKHWAVGCYLTHCGWNSTLEAIRYGKRLLCCPISGDQFINCAYIVKVWRIGIMLSDIERSVVRDDIRRVMEDEEGGVMQERVFELKKRVMGDEGISRAATGLLYFIDAITKNMLCFESM